MTTHVRRLLSWMSVPAAAAVIAAPAAHAVDPPQILFPADGQQFVARQWDGHITVQADPALGHLYLLVSQSPALDSQGHIDHIGYGQSLGLALGRIPATADRWQLPPYDPAYAQWAEWPHSKIPGTVYMQVHEACSVPDCAESPVLSIYNRPLPPAQPLLPTDGAVFPSGAQIAFRVQNPPLLTEKFPPNQGPWTGTVAIMSSYRPGVDADGMLNETGGGPIGYVPAFNSAADRDLGGGVWETAPSEPIEVGATYYWQTLRNDNFCNYQLATRCTNYGPVRSFTVLPGPPSKGSPDGRLARVGGPLRQRLLRNKHLAVSVRCRRACKVKLTGRLLIAGHAFKLPTVTRQLARRRKKGVRIRPGASLLRRVAAALDRHQLVKAKLAAHISWDHGRHASTWRLTIRVIL